MRPQPRLLALGTTAAVLVGGLALIGSASAAGVCPTYTDAAGDATYVAPGPDPAGLPLTGSDDDLDLLDVSHSVDAGVFTTVWHMKAINTTGAYFNVADRFTSSFTVGGKAGVVTASRDYTGSQTMTGKDSLAGSLSVAGTTKTTKVTVTADVKKSTVTASIAAADMDTAFGAPLTGLPFSGMKATSVLYQPPVPQTRDVDTATAPATASYTFGGSCSGALPAPGPSESPSDEPSQQPSEQPSATASASETPSAEPSEAPTEEPPAAPVLFAQPRTGCFLFKDATGDAKPGRAPLTSPNNDDDLDLTEVALKTAPDSLQVFTKVAKLGTAPTTPVFTGHSFTVGLTVGGKALTVTATKSGAATSNSSGLKATAAFDTAKSNVVWTLPQADLETIAGGPVGDVTAITVTSNATNAGGTFDGDTATGSKPEEKTYAYGDNTCFQPPAGKLALGGAVTGQYTDTAVVTATLVDSADAAVEGATVKLELAGLPPVTATTDGAGLATFSLPLTVTAGAKALTATYVGSDTVGPAKADGTFTVAAEKAVLKAVAGKGTVTATLTDDDRTPLAGQVVVFTVGSKTTKAKTNAKGVAVLTRQTAGATVKVAFAAVKDRYSAAPAVSAKVR